MTNDKSEEGYKKSVEQSHSESDKKESSINSPRTVHLAPKRGRKEDAITAYDVAYIISKEQEVYYDKLLSRVTYFNRGVYTDAYDMVRDYAVQLMKHDFRKYHLEDISEMLKTMCDKTLESPPKNWILLNDGVFDLETEQLMPLNPKYVFFERLDVSYHEEPTNELEPIMRGILNAQQYLLFMDWVGYSLFRGYRKAGSLFVVGDGNNGKSTLADIVLSLFKGATASVTLQELMIPERRSRLVDKRVNVVSELPAETILRSEAFKQMTAGDQISARYLHRDNFEFVNFAKFFFFTNKLPKILDSSYGLYRRLYLIELLNQVDGSITKDEIQAMLEKPSVRAWLFREAVRGYHRIMNSKADSSSAGRYQLLADSAGYFIDQFVRARENATIKRTELYENYSTFCKKNNVPPISNIRFFNVVRKRFEGAFQENEETHGGHSWRFDGIEMKSSSDIEVA